MYRDVTVVVVVDVAVQFSTAFEIQSLTDKDHSEARDNTISGFEFIDRCLQLNADLGSDRIA